MVELSHKEYTSQNSEHWVECELCKFRSKELSLHLKSVHGINSSNYKGEVKSTIIRQNMKGENNPAYNHGGKYSKWSKNFIHGYDEESHMKFNAEHSIRQTNNHKNHFSRAHYSSDEKYSKAQTRDLDWFISKYGEEEGLIRYAAKTLKWMKSCQKQTYSKISQQLFTVVDKLYAAGDTFYATKDRPDMSGYKNKEYRLEIGLMPDYIDLSTKKIIEFDGVYWHTYKSNPQREAKRDARLLEAGYKVLHVCENDFRKNPEKVIKECLDFLTQ